ncbi:hypothetical protein OUZ56_029834 [Daphnia magna]|uniref:Uncharacterized protein n=1 Tax=Daphnia magna TaxID=35525 RepID=A0ABR0B805_9CRUS|nr:hypothetical protein OUZ56_029834 [Daphnia magna]
MITRRLRSPVLNIHIRITNSEGENMEGINVEEAIAKQLLKNAETRQQNLLDRIISGLQRQPSLEQRELAIYRESLEAVTQECLEHHKKYVAAGEGDASEHSTYEETTKQKINEVNRTIQESLIASKRASPTQTSDEHAKRRRMELERKLQEVKEKALQAQREQRDIEAALKEQEVPRTSTPIRPE